MYLFELGSERVNLSDGLTCMSFLGQISQSAHLAIHNIRIAD